MMFQPVSSLKEKTEKKEFLELAGVYTRLVQVFCEKQGITPESGNVQPGEFLKELQDTGVIESGQDLPVLEEVLGKEWPAFREAVAFVCTHREETEGLVDRLSGKGRREWQKREETEKKPSLVDFFCGAGGLSLGFVQAGFSIKLANDTEEVCMETYRYNHPEIPPEKTVRGDIRKLVEHLEDYIQEAPDVVAGGPPCQGFSEANRQRVIDDPRNRLYKYFIKAVEKLAPKFVVMENVKGMMKVAHQVVEDYEALRIVRGDREYTYRAACQLLNSQDFSVAQSRERLIYIAVRSDVQEKWGITPESLFEEIRENCQGNPVYCLEDALEEIRPLDAPRIKNQNEVDSETTGKKIDVNRQGAYRNPYLRLINGDREIPFLFNHKARYVSDVNYEIYRRLNPGDDATDEKIADIMPYAHRNHCFKDKYFKLIPDRPCRTITAHLKMDCHSHIHPYQVRSLTPREAARVQSFPDDYLFLGPYLKTYMQIGNAVPPLMAAGIAKVIKKYTQ